MKVFFILPVASFYCEFLSKCLKLHINGSVLPGMPGIGSNR